MARRRKSNRLSAKKEKAPNSVTKFMDDEAEEDKPELKEKQTTFSMATPAVTPDSKLQHSKISKVPRPSRPAKKAARFEPHILATPDFGHHPRYGENKDELIASINFKTPDGQDAYGNILYPGENNDFKMPAKEDALVPSADEVPATPHIFDPNQVNQEASKPSSVLPTKRPMKSIDDKDASSSDDSMAEYVPRLAPLPHSIVKTASPVNTGYVYYEHLHGGLAIFRVEDAESGRDAYIEQAIRGLVRPEFAGFKTFQGWLSLHANTDDRLAGNRDPFKAKCIILFKGSIKKEAKETTARFFKTLTTFLNQWKYARGKLECVKHEGGHWYNYQPSQSTFDRTQKDKRKLCDLVCTQDSLSIVRSIAIDTFDYSSDCCYQDKNFTTKYFNPPYTPAMMASLQMDTPNG
jgi:hypothetical protein